MLSEQRQQQLISEGFMALTQGQLVQAAQAAEEILHYRRGFGDAWVLLCSALIKMESHDDLRALEDALTAIPANDPARLPLNVELTRVLARRGRCARAVAQANILSERLDLAAEHHEALGSAYGISALFEKSLHHATKAIEMEPNNPNYLYSFGLSLRYAGQLSHSERVFDQVIASNPYHSLSYFSRADLKRWSVDDNHIEEIQQIKDQPALTVLGQAQLQFALFKELDDCKAYEKAWEALAAGCELVSQTIQYPTIVRREAAQKSVDVFRGIFPSAAEPVPNCPTPVFIVGLPRSGTTLVERILARHSDVVSMGETQAFPLAFRDSLAIPEDCLIDKNIIEQSASTNWTSLRDRYVESVDYLRGQRRYCIDKLPHNYEFVGHIMQAFPNARIINLTRNPLDSLFGAYRILFGAGSYQWSYDQANLAEAYRVYRLLIDGWRTAYGKKFIDVSLTSLIDNSEFEIRQLLAKLDLDFEPACLSPEKSGGGVSTASSVQIRSPINRSGVDVWRNYAHYLEPLRRELEADGFVDENGNQIV